MYYDEYLNHKSLLTCEEEKDIEQHNNDCNKMFELLMDYAPHGAIAKISHQDLYHKTHEKDMYKLIDKHGYDDMIQAFDIKNGIDFVIHDDEVGIAVYGQNYLFSGKHYMNEVLIQFHFLDAKKADIISIQEQLDDIYSLEKEQTLLRELYEKDIYIQNTDLKTQLRNGSMKPIQEKINDANIKKTQNNTQISMQGYKDTVHKEQNL